MMRRSQPTSTRYRRGYVLVVTLGLLVLAATLLVGIGRAAVAHALDAHRQEEELQSRWGVISCRAALLPQADDALARLEQEMHRPLPVWRTSIQLGSQQFNLALADEQAKANVNVLIDRDGKSAAEERVRDALSGSGLVNALILHTASIQPDRKTNAVPRWIDGFGQLFDDVEPARLLNAVGTPPVDTLTCWGNGAINVMRASESSFTLMANPAMNRLDIGRMLKLRDSAFAPLDVARSNLAIRPTDDAPPPRSGDAIVGLLSRAKIDPAIRQKVGMVSHSSCHSLWITVQDRARRRDFLFVSDESQAGDRQIRAFEW